MDEKLAEVSRDELLLMIQNLNNQVAALKAENDFYKEQIALAKQRKFGRSSEKTNEYQMSMLAQLFNEPEAIKELEASVKEDFDKQPEPRKKSGPNKKHITKGAIENVSEVIHRLSEEQKNNPAYSDKLRVFEEPVYAYTETIYHRGYYEQIHHYQEIAIYDCMDEEIEGPHGEHKVIKAELPKKILPKSTATPSMLAKIITDKYEKAMPLYRQEKEYEEIGLNLSRQTMSNWIIKLDELYIHRLVEYMNKKLNQSKVALVDETPLEVLNHPTKEPSPNNSYMWVKMSGPYEPIQIAIYRYQLGRDHEFALDLLEGYDQIVQSDGYEAYDKISNVHIGCWVHMRRYLENVLKALPKGMKQSDTVSYELKAKIDKMFAIERKIKGKTPEERVRVRKEKTAHLIDEFYEKVHMCKERLEDQPTTEYFRKAINYAISQEEKLRLVLEYGEVDISTNAVENIIRNFTVGRRSWLFFNSVHGAQSGADLYSIIVTAKINGLQVYRYLEYLFTQLIEIDITSEEEIEKIMPWSTDLPDDIKKPKKA